MSFTDDGGVLRAPALAALPWLDHGFGTRHSSAALTSSLPLATLRQIHSDRIVTVTTPGSHGEGDALSTATPHVYPSIRTADCLPLLVVDPDQRVVAAVHAGWRGTVADIAGHTVRHLAAEFGSKPASLLAALGPCISACCFEVGPEVATAFQPLFPERDDLDRQTRVDLVEANRRQLVQAGLDPAHISASNRCTLGEPDHFFSYRRAQEAGRLVSYIGLV